MGWSRRVRAALAAAVAVCVLATLWRMSECWSGSCAYLRYFSGDHPAGGRKRSDDHPAVPGAGGEVASGGGNEGPAGAHKVVPNRAVAVVFSDVHDVLVLERALALWRSIGMFFSPGIEDDVVAIVPRYRALLLEAPLREIGYRVLPRDSPAPAWRTSGRFVQQALTGAGKSKGWSLLALEALSLTEYEEVVVLDQKMFLFPSSGSPATGEQRDAAGAEGVGGDLGAGGDGDGGSPWDLLLRLLPPRVPGGNGGWNVAFAEGGEASVARGEGLTALPGALGDFVSRRHASLMVVRPSLRLYESVAKILCKGDAVMDGAYTDLARPHGESIRSAALERRAPTAPLLHVAIAISLSSNSSSPPPPPDDYAPLLPLKPCGGYGNGQSNSNNNRGALPIAWCPPEQGGENHAEEKGEGVESDQRHGPGRVLAGLSLPPPQQQRRKKESLERRGRYGTTPGAAAATGSGEPTKNRSRGGSRNAPKTPPLEIDGFQSRQGFAPSPRRGAGKSDARRETGTGRKGRGVTASTSPTISSGESADGGRATRAAVRHLSAESSAGVVRGGTRGEPNAEVSIHGRNDEEDGEKKGGFPKAVGGTKSPDGVENQAKIRVGNGGWRTWWWWQRRRELEQEVVSGRSVSFAWIPGDPCSCAGVENGEEGDEGGVVGEACRAWLEARAAPLMAGDEDPPDARSACNGGAFASPRSVPRPLETSVLQKLEFAAATAGASVAASGVGDGKEAAIGGGVPASVAGEEEDVKGDAHEEEGAVVMPPVPPPLWQERPTTKVVVTQEDLKNFQHFWAVNEEKKLLMVAIPKVACTQVHALFLRMQGSKRWNTSLLSEIHFHKDQSKYTMSTVKGMTAQKATDILNDPSWTRGVFLRDPAERLLSCFLDKIVHRKSYSVKILKAREILSFESFVGLLSKDARERYGDTFPGPQLGISRRSNPHWRPQVYFGLDKFLPYFDFIGDFNHMQEHSEELLRRAGLWEEFGASGWGPGGKNAFFQRPTVQGHATGSESAKSLYYSYPLLTSVREAYGPTDYRMLARLGWWNETAFPLGY